jgi:hypothetical protein
LLAFMGANREPSNQSFEVDREATVCSANRRFFFSGYRLRELDVRYVPILLQKSAMTGRSGWCELLE